MKISFYVLLSVLFLQGCAAVNTFPTIARAGDTVSLLIGGSEDARKNTTTIVLTDSNNNVWDLNALGAIRSVFSVRPDGRSEGLHYSSFLELNTPWAFGHEPIQTVAVVNIPIGTAPGMATLELSTNTTDNSSAAPLLFTINIEIIPGAGTADNFLFKHVINGESATNFTRVEPLPQAKISFGFGQIIGAASIVVDFDETIINPDTITVYVPQSTVRDQVTNTFDKIQRMVNWRQDGDFLYIDVIAPQGIDSSYLNLYVLHPRGLSGIPDFNLISTNTYDVNGDLLSLMPVFEYIP